MRLPSVGFAVILGSSAALLGQQRQLNPDLSYVVNPKESRVEFFVHSTLADVNGVFSKWQAEFKAPTPRVEDSRLTLHLTSSNVSTGNAAKDKMIRGENFFWIQKYPAIDFVSTRITPDPGNPLKFTMDGNFTMRGVTKPVTLQLTIDPHGNQHVNVYGDLSFDRREFGMSYQMPFNRISDSVRVRFDLDVQGTAAAEGGTQQ